MSRQSQHIFALLIALCAMTAGAVSEPWTREVIVKWREQPVSLDSELLPQPAREYVTGIRAALPIAVRTNAGLERICVLEICDAADAAAVAALLQNDPRVEYAEPRILRFIDGWTDGGRRGRNGALDAVPNDPFYGQQWGLQAMEAEAAWNITRGDPSVAIAVLDLGVDFTHPELTHCRWENAAEILGAPGVDDDGNGYVDDFYGWDFVDGDGEPWGDLLDGDEMHGTHVAGLAVAARNNGIGIAGLAPDCKVMGVRVGAHGEIPYGYEGIYYACRTGVKIMNCSWGGFFESAYERDVIRYVTEQGCVVVASAGNSATSAEHYPAGIEGVLSVAASQIGDFAASFTQYGSWVKISAPGVAMLSTINTAGGGHSYGTWQGTSMSAPLVAATCALVAGRFPQMDGRQIMARVTASADPIDGRNPDYAGQLGLGRANAWRALCDSLSGIRIGEATYEEIFGNGDGRIRAGETAELRVSVYNDGASTGAAVGWVATMAAEVALRNPVLLYDDLPPGGPHPSETAVTVEVLENSPRGTFLPLSIDFLDATGRLTGRAVTTVYLDSTFVCVGNGRLDLGFSEDGSLGYYDRERDHYLGCGLRTVESSNALYHGSFVLAADGVVQDNAYGNAALNRYDWGALNDSVAHMIVSERADVEARASFEDRRTEQRLFARVDAAALGWRGEGRDGFLLLEYTVENRSVNPWNEVYAGFFLDWDVGPSSHNVALFDDEMDIAVVQAPGTSHPLAGVASITDEWRSFRVINNRDEIHPPWDEQDPLSGWTDERKWEILRGGIQAPPVDAMDLSFLIATGPFGIAAHEVRTFAYALVTGNSLNELRAQAAAARAAYAGRKSHPREDTAARKVKAGLYPNPVATGEPLRLVLPESAEATVRFYNLLGQQVTQAQHILAGPDGSRLEVAIPNHASGLLFYTIETDAGRFSGKLLLVR